MNKVKEVSIGNGVVVIRRDGISAPIIAGILGFDMDVSGAPKAIYLDSLVHGCRETDFGQYEASGAVSTVLRGKC